MMTFIKKKFIADKITKKEIGLLSAGLLVFALISLGNMSRWSIWFDEAFSAYLLRYNALDIARYTATDVHPPLYYWLLKFWSMIFGESIIALRSLSMVFIVGAIVIAYFFVRKYFGRLAAGVTIGFMALSPMLIRYSEEARMYGLVVLIATAATAVMVEATFRPTRRKWIFYGVLVSLGMWAHYFSAIVWLSHWVWRLVVRGRFKSTKQFFSKGWIIAHLLAVALYLPWLPFMIQQMRTVQTNGFWIKDVTVNSITNIITNTFVFLEYSDVKKWLALLVIGTVVLSCYLIVRARHALAKDERPVFDLLLCMTIAPVLILFVTSLPPLRPSYVERYLLTAVFWAMMLLAVSLVYGIKKGRSLTLAAVAVPFALCLVLGTMNVYQYGNFNRNANEASSTKDLLHIISSQAKDGEPILAESPWRFYESIYYDTPEHPVYFEAQDDAPYGSYDMLRFSDYRKIKDLDSFGKGYPFIWYVGAWQDGKQHTPDGEWKVIKEVAAPSPVKGSGTMRAFQLEYIGA